MNLKQKLSSNHILAISIGVVYLWFGVLKYFPELSPAEDLAKNTINALTINLIPSNVSIILLAVWESLVGILLILNIFPRATILFALTHMLLTFTPLFLFPEQVFNNEPFQLTLLGQYIFKNVIIIGGLLTLYKLHSENTKLRVAS
ncbi:hypothetical protein N9934_03535 [Desulfosarcina sp.]|nr:hypothetical protein [Desulfosarcina sp.]